MRYCLADCLRVACWGCVFLAALLFVVGGAVTL
jgi:hypothetical protein